MNGVEGERLASVVGIQGLSSIFGGGISNQVRL